MEREEGQDVINDVDGEHVSSIDVGRGHVNIADGTVGNNSFIPVTKFTTTRTPVQHSQKK